MATELTQIYHPIITRYDINNSTCLLSEPLSYTPRKHALVNSFVL